jgi:hypothetical protein
MRDSEPLQSLYGIADRKPKYRNRKTVVDGITFHSAKEAKRYGELKMLERAGEITGLQLQPRFKLDVCGRHVCTYVGDFQYLERNGGVVVEDVKGHRTETYKVKAKLFHAVIGFPIREV